MTKVLDSPKPRPSPKSALHIEDKGLTSFRSLVISRFRFDKFRTLLIGLPSSVVSAGSMIAWGYFSMKHRNLWTWGMIVPLLPAIAGIANVYATQGTGANKYGRVFAYWLINSYAVTVSLGRSHPSRNMTNPFDFSGHFVLLSLGRKF